jgi:hypothetical protein
LSPQSLNHGQMNSTKKSNHAQIVQIDSLIFLSKLNFIKFSLKLIPVNDFLLPLPLFLPLRLVTSWANSWWYLNQCYFFNLFCSEDIVQGIRQLVVKLFFVFAKKNGHKKCLYTTSRWQWCVIFNFFWHCSARNVFCLEKKNSLSI